MQTADTSTEATPIHGERAIPALDGLRGIAVLAVMLHHFMPYWGEDTPLRHVLSKLLHGGWSGVDLFFVLSGFLITGILQDAKQSQHYFRNFYMRRVLRICPVYYGLLAILFILLPFIANNPWLHSPLHIDPAGIWTFLRDLPEKQSWLWLYLVNFRIAWVAGTETSYFGYLTPFWSLSIEEHFYLVWPLLIYNCSRATVIRICLGCVVVALGARAACVLAGAPFVVPYMLTPCRMESLALGGLVAILARSPGGLRAYYSKALAALLVLAPAVLLLMALCGRADPWMTIPGYTLLALVFAAIIIVSVGGNKESLLNRALSFTVLRSFGKYSYCLYAIHVIVRTQLEAFLPRYDLATRMHSMGWGGICWTTIGIGISFAIAFASWHLVEKHFLKMKRFFKDTPRAATVPAAAVPDQPAV